VEGGIRHATFDPKRDGFAAIVKINAMFKRRPNNTLNPTQAVVVFSTILVVLNV
jgi:hypothetical protein